MSHKNTTSRTAAGEVVVSASATGKSPTSYYSTDAATRHQVPRRCRVQNRAVGNADPRLKLGHIRKMRPKRPHVLSVNPGSHTRCILSKLGLEHRSTDEESFNRTTRNKQPVSHHRPSFSHQSTTFVRTGRSGGVWFQRKEEGNASRVRRTLRV
ncbi:hypothetical protein VUR80DRAFT_6820 [Thermomyces stellatus]